MWSFEFAVEFLYVGKHVTQVRNSWSGRRICLSESRGILDLIC